MAGTVAVGSRKMQAAVGAGVYLWGMDVTRVRALRTVPGHDQPGDVVRVVHQESEGMA
ncbi:MAG TPA: hypothetical protein VFN34_02825 [Ornithinibacter sp.]|nr:hypothetical protein [Ornithinibacter sp.]